MPLCVYPDVPRYDGRGDPTVSSSYKCKKDFGKPGRT
jgi:hypothetical protein